MDTSSDLHNSISVYTIERYDVSLLTNSTDLLLFDKTLDRRTTNVLYIQ